MEGERTLQGNHPNLVATYDPAAATWVPLNGWQTDGATVLFHESSIDLSGYSMEDLTMYIEDLAMQDPGVYSFTAGPSASFSALQVLDVITSVPIKDIAAVSQAQVLGTGIATLGSPFDFEQVLLGTYRFFTPNALIPYPGYQQLTRTQRFDSGEPNAADKLYCYRIITTIADDLGPESVIAVPACRQMIGARFHEEAFLHYMMRLKRSYELANQL